LRSRLSSYLVVFAAICSGAAALTLEVVWSKALVVPLGNSTDATALVLAGFMLGMAVGAWLGARVAAHVGRALIIYAIAELGLGLFACGVPQIIVQLAHWVPPVWLAGAGFAVRSVIALCLITLPCFVMGASLPLLLAARPVLGRARFFVGVLYGLNTLGASLASVVAGFYGVAHWGITGCSKRAAACSAGAALLAVMANALILKSDRDESPERDEPNLDEPVPEKNREAPSQPVASTSPIQSDASASHALDFPWLPERSFRRFLLCWCSGTRPGTQHSDGAAAGHTRIALTIAFATGFALLAAEVFWARILTFVFGHDTYAFATLLCVVVLGHALGGFVYAWLAKRSPLMVAAWCVSLTSLALLGSFYLASGLIIHGGRDPFGLGDRHLGGAALSLEMLREWAYTPLLVLLPCLFSGITYPAGVSLYSSSGVSVSAAVGKYGLVNGLGAAAGATVASFGLVTWLGIQGVVSVSSAFLALVVAALFIRVAKTRTERWGACLPAIMVLFAIVLVPRDLPKRMLSSVVGKRHQQLIYYEEARTATVSVIGNSINGERQLLVNAVNEVTTRLVHDQSFKLLGQLGPLLHPHPKRAVMICLGAGLAAGSALSHPLEQLDVVDLLGAVRHGAGYFAEENNHVLQDARLKLHVDDGRQFLLTTPDRYDLAIVDSTHPKSVDSWILYTRQFFQLLRDRLNEGGIAVEWLPLHGLSEREFRSVVATFASVFPQMTLWASVGYETYGQVGYAKLVGQRGSAPVSIDLERMDAGLRQPKVQHDLARYGMGTLAEILDQFVAGPTRIREWTAGCPIHEDDRPFLGYVTELSQGSAMTPDQLLAVREAPNAYFSKPLARGSRLEADIHRAFDAQGLVIAGQLEAAQSLNPSGEKIGRYIEQTRTSLAYYQALSRRYPNDSERQFEAATQLLALGHADVAESVFDEAIRRHPGSFRLRLNQGLLWLELGQAKRAADRFARLLGEYPGAAILNQNLGVALLAQGEPGAAHRRLAMAVDANPSNFNARLSLVDAEMALGNWRGAEAQLAALLRDEPRSEQALVRLAQVSEGLGEQTNAQNFWVGAVRVNPYREKYALEWTKHLMANQSNASIEVLRREQFLHPTSAAVKVALGQALAQWSQWPEASQAFVDALEIDSRSRDAALGLGHALTRLGRPHQALDALCLAQTLGATQATIVAELRNLGKGPQECQREGGP
jgi:spermidine synthase